MLSGDDGHRPQSITVRRVVLLVSWLLTLGALVLVANGMLRPNFVLADVRFLFFAGLLALELSGVYLIRVYNERRKTREHDQVRK